MKKSGKSNNDLSEQATAEAPSWWRRLKGDKTIRESKSTPATEEEQLPVEEEAVSVISINEGMLRDKIDDRIQDVTQAEAEAFILKIIAMITKAIPLYQNLLAHEGRDVLVPTLSNMTYTAIAEQFARRNDYIALEDLRRAILSVMEPTFKKGLKNKSELMKSAKCSTGKPNSWSEQGLRESNEDRHVSMPYLNSLSGKRTDQPLSYFAVFDGHGGVECAHYVSAMLHVNLVRHPQLHENMRQVLFDSFMYTQKQWSALADKTGFSASSGATAVVSVVQNSNLYIAWAGDSSAILFLKNRIWLDFVMPHKPTFDNEKQRIIKLGGTVQNDRVNGSLAVSRSFGDLIYGCVNPEPDILEYTMTGNELFLVLACDGLTDVIDPSGILEIVEKCIQNNESHKISQILVEEALMRGSTDNVSVVFVPLEKPRQFSEREISDVISLKEPVSIPKIPGPIRRESIVPGNLSDSLNAPQNSTSSKESKSTTEYSVFDTRSSVISDSSITSTSANVTTTSLEFATGKSNRSSTATKTTYKSRWADPATISISELQALAALSRQFKQASSLSTPVNEADPESLLDNYLND